MNKDTKTYLYLVIIIAVIILAIYAYRESQKITPEQELAKCIGENSVVYTQTGCSACKYQESLFGDNYQYISYIDCKVETQKCIDAQITGTPTWIIKEEKYPGVQTIEKLKELAGC